MSGPSEKRDSTWDTPTVSERRPLYTGVSKKTQSRKTKLYPTESDGITKPIGLSWPVRVLLCTAPKANPITVVVLSPIVLVRDYPDTDSGIAGAEDVTSKTDLPTEQ
jgi:hypothetical protein